MWCGQFFGPCKALEIKVLKRWRAAWGVGILKGKRGSGRGEEGKGRREDRKGRKGKERERRRGRMRGQRKGKLSSRQRETSC